MNLQLTRYQRVRIILISLLFIGTKRRPGFRCMDFVKHVFKAARIPSHDSFKNISTEEKDRPPWGEAVFLLEKGVKSKRWSHVGIALPFGYLLHMSFYWGMKVTITPVKEIWEKYDLAK